MSFAKRITRKTSTILNKYFKDLNKYAPILTILLTVGAGAITGLVRYGFYVYNLGVTSYWGLPKEIISVKSDSILFEVLMYAIIVIPILLFNKMIYKGLKKWRTKSKVKYRIFLIITLIIYVALLIIGALVSHFLELVTLILTLIFVLFTVFCLPAFSMCVGDGLFDFIDHIKRNKEQTDVKSLENNNESDKSLTFLDKIRAISVAFILMALMFTAALFISAKLTEYGKTDFRVVEITSANEKEKCQSYVIVYETDDKYYICPCVMNGDKITNIKEETKNTIPKEYIEYTHCEYIKK